MNGREVRVRVCFVNRGLSGLREHFGAEEACWAHNPKVVGSRPTSAIFLVVTVFEFSEVFVSSQCDGLFSTIYCILV